MLSAEARVSIATPARYMSRLCNHFAHRVTVHREPDHARIEFPNAPCSLRVLDDRLQIRIECEELPTLERFQEVVARHLKQVAPEETFEVDWQIAR
jgi:hypothetical protein